MSNTVEVLQKTQASLEKKTNYRWVVMGLIFVIWAIACADRANLGIALPYMKKEYGIVL